MLKQRVITALFLASSFMAVLFLAPSWLWGLCCIVVVLVSASELARLSGVSSLLARRTLSLAAAVVFLAISRDGASGNYLYWFACAFWVGAAPVLLGQGTIPRSTGALLAIGLPLLVAATLALFELRSDIPLRLLLLLCVIWISDSTAYFVGRLVGKRKLAPRISPGKTWEGAAAGVLAVGIFSLIGASWWPELATPWWMEGKSPALVCLLWIGFAMLGISGDLLESMLKRSAGEKDSGNILPGHGGLLDRVDALLPVLPIAALTYLN